MSCVVLALRDGRTTTVPVSVLAGDRDEFVARLRALLREGRAEQRSPVPGFGAEDGACNLSDASGRRRLVRFMAPAC